MSERTREALLTAGIWLVAVVVLRLLLRRALAGWEHRHAESDLDSTARRRTTFSVLQRVVVAFVVVIGAWNVLRIFPVTEDVARALLASSAVVAIVVGLALTTPLGNLGSGVLVGLTQPVRLGDRVTVGEHTGFVEAINLIYTQLVTDDERRIFVPNTQLTASAVVNRTIRDPRRAVPVALPVRLDASLRDARALLHGRAVALPAVTDARVAVTDVTDKLAWLTVTAYTPLGADVAAIASDLREDGLTALGDAGLLP